MAIINKYRVVDESFSSAQRIHNNAVALLAYSTAIPFRSLQSKLDAMRVDYLGSIQVMLNLGNATQVNAVVDMFYAGSLPANTYTSFQAVGTALLAFYQAYDVVFDTLTPISFDPATGHTYEDISLAQLATLSDELTAVRDACLPLI